MANLSDSFRHYSTVREGRLESDEDVVLSDSRCQEPLLNGALLQRPVLAPDDGVLDRIDAFFSAAQFGAIVWSAWPTPDLRARGWEMVGHPPLMLLLPGHPTPPPPAELIVEEVVDGRGVADFERVLVEGFPLTAVGPCEPGRLFDERVLGGSYRAWVGRVDGEALAVGAAHVAGGVTGVEWIATLPEARGRGYGAALTWQAATCVPGQLAFLHASDAGRTVYERMGFLSLLRFTLWLRPPFPG